MVDYNNSNYVSQKQPSDVYPGLEVGKAPCSTLPEVSPRQHDLDKIVYNSDDTLVNAKSSFHVTRKRLIIGITITILIIVAAVVGTVVGVVLRNKNSKSSSMPNNFVTPNPSTEEPTDPNDIGWKIRNDSGLAVTGWRDGNDFRGRLFYQDNAGFLRVSLMDSLSDREWSKGKKILKAKAKIGTPLAASSKNQSIYDNSKTAMETHLFYLSEDSTLQELVFNGNDISATEGSLNSQNIKPANDSQFGSYWPSLAYQTSDGHISELRYNCTTDAKNCWNQKTFSTELGGPSIPIAIAPMGRKFTGNFIYYESKAHELKRDVWKNSTGEWTTESWSQSVPPSTSIAVLTTPHNTTSPNLDHFILWQDLSAKIEVSRPFVDDISITPPAFKTPRPGTDIACLNQAIWWDEPMEEGENGPDLTRCFYQGIKGNLRQVQWTGKQWIDLGVVMAVGWSGGNNDENA